LNFEAIAQALQDAIAGIQPGASGVSEPDAENPVNGAMDQMHQSMSGMPVAVGGATNNEQ
jgi:hypothetical protein